MKLIEVEQMFKPVFKFFKLTIKYTLPILIIMAFVKWILIHNAISLTADQDVVYGMVTVGLLIYNVIAGVSLALVEPDEIV